MALIVFSTTFGWYATLALALVISTLSLIFSLVILIVGRRELVALHRTTCRLSAGQTALDQQVKYLQHDIRLLIQQLNLTPDSFCISRI